jgi:hypothetical protein
MRHIAKISRTHTPAKGGLDIFETIIVVLLSVFFKDWDNFLTVIKNLEKYYEKTP